MISARQFAEQYPGHVVKITAEAAKEFAVKPQVLGIVVGFRPGTKGIIGSSKVAIWHDKYEMLFGLNPKTDMSFHHVVTDPPDRRQGIYFLSVSAIELLEQLKPTVTYPSRCRRCKSPARSGKFLTVCSNPHCKVNGITIKALGPFPKIKLMNSKGYLLCPICQGDQLDFSGSYGNHEGLVCLANKRHVWKHTWKEGQKINHKGSSVYIWRNNQLSHPLKSDNI